MCNPCKQMVVSVPDAEAFLGLVFEVRRFPACMTCKPLASTVIGQVAVLGTRIVVCNLACPCC